QTRRWLQAALMQCTCQPTDLGRSRDAERIAHAIAIHEQDRVVRPRRPRFRIASGPLCLINESLDLFPMLLRPIESIGITEVLKQPLPGPLLVFHSAELVQIMMAVRHGGVCLPKLHDPMARGNGCSVG